jgi:hypothetical protein
MLIHLLQPLWATWDWATRFSFVAVVVSAFTLIGVLAQILLASSEIGLVKADVRQNKRMIDEALKHPELVLQYGGGGSAYHANAVSGQDRCAINLSWYEIVNIGERTAHNVYVELYVPLDIISDPGQHRSIPIKEVEHVVYAGYTPTNPVHPKRTPVRAYTGREHNPVLLMFTEQQTLRWRIFDDYGIHPQGYGTLYLDPVPPTQ